MHTTTNFLLANLAVAGLWIAFWSVPFVILNSLTHVHEEGGQFLCKFLSMNNMSGISIVVSVGTMTLLAVERYFALLKPMNTRLRIEKSAVWKYVTGLWLFATLLNMPTILYAETKMRVHLEPNAIRCYNRFFRCVFREYHNLLLR